MSSKRNIFYLLLLLFMSQLTYEQAVILEHIEKTNPRAKQQHKARLVGTTQPTISRELGRAKKLGISYTASIRNERSETREKVNKKIHMKVLLGSELESYILEKVLIKTRSPEQIAGVRQGKNGEKVTHPTIYKFLYTYHPELREKLRRKGKKYRTGNKAGISHIPNRISIHQRPAEVETKERLGDMEGDTIVGSNTGDRIATLVERKSRYLSAGLVLQQKGSSLSISVCTSLMQMIDRMPIKHTLTLDNGIEFADHGYLTEMFSLAVFFADPYSSRQRGCNENHNGLLREFIPKGTDFTTITQEQLDGRVSLINNRPRKVLGWKTAHQVFYSL